MWTFATDRRFEETWLAPRRQDRHGVVLDDGPFLAVASRLGALVRRSADATKRDVVFAGLLETITPWSWDWFDGAP